MVYSDSKDWITTILSQLESKAVISFDVFDTAILRTVSRPEAVFKLIERQIEVKFGSRIRFHDVRIIAEQMRRREMGSSREITLDEIYVPLREYLRISEEQAEYFKQLEISFELENTYANPHFVQLFKAVVGLGKMIIFTTDTYLSADIIRRIIIREGYHFDHLFVSSTEGTSKYSRDLYCTILEKLRVSHRDLLHIGDDYFSDVLQPASLNIAAYHYYPEVLKKQSSKGRKASALAELRKHSYQKSGAMSIVERVGFSCGAIIYASFLKWLIEEQASRGVSKIFFLSRDGYILKEIFDMIRQAGIYRSFPSSRYLFISRKVLGMACINELDDNAMEFLIYGNCEMPVRHFLEQIGITAEPLAKIVRLNGYQSVDERVGRSPSDVARLKNLLWTCREEVLFEGARIRKKLVQYLRESGFADCPRAAIVATGWHGSQQGGLNLLCRRESFATEIRGFYYGLFPPFSNSFSFRPLQCETDMSLTFGFIAGRDTPRYEQRIILFKTLPFLEVILSAPHGGVINYTQKADGTMGPLCTRNDSESVQFSQFIGPFQNSALKGVEWLLSNQDWYDRLSKVDCLEALKDLCINPTNRELQVFGKLKYFWSIDHLGIGKAICDFQP